MFPPSKWSLKDLKSYCSPKFSANNGTTTIRPQWLPLVLYIVVVGPNKHKHKRNCNFYIEKPSSVIRVFITITITITIRINFNFDSNSNVYKTMGMHNMAHFIQAASRIVFVYGLRDPWHTQGIADANLSASLPVVAIADGSHCADLAEENSRTDTASMVEGRKKTEAILAQWIGEVQAQAQAGA